MNCLRVNSSGKVAPEPGAALDCGAAGLDDDAETTEVMNFEGAAVEVTTGV